MKIVIVNLPRRSPSRILYWLPNGSCYLQMYWYTEHVKFGWPVAEGRWCTTSEDVVRYGYDLLDLAAAYSSGAALYASLLPAKARDWTPHNSKLIRPPYSDEPNQFPQPALSFKTAGVPFTRQSWVQFLLDEMTRYRLSKERYLPMLKQPATLVRLGYRLARVAGRQRGVKSPEFAMALTIFGLGAIGLGHRRACQFCFRVAVPALSHCEIHSQAKELRARPSIDHARQAANARIGKLAAKAIQWEQGVLGVCIPVVDPQPWVIAGLLWNSILGDKDKWRSEIFSALRAAPLVRARLPSNFEALESRRMLSELRSALDPHEWLTYSWPTKIRAAQLWFETEASVAPGHPPKGPRIQTAERLAMAIQLFENGKSKSEVARALGISDSYLSHILKRYG